MPDQFTVINIKPVDDGFIVGFHDANPNFDPKADAEMYSPTNLPAIQRTKLFLEGAKLVEWLQERITK